MKISSTSSRLKQIITEQNLKQVDILEKCYPFSKEYNVKLGRNDLSQYVSGKVLPGQDKLSILSMGLKVSEAWLMGYDVPMEINSNLTNSNLDKEETTLLNNFNKLNLTGKNEANKRVEELTHIPKYTENNKFIKPNFKKKVTKSEKIPFYEVSVSAGTGNWLENSTYEIVSVDRSIYPKADFILRIAGDSMEPKYSNGDIVYVKEQHSIDNGKIGIFIYNNEAYIKKYEVKEDGQYLISLNKKYPPIKIDEYSTFKICGLIL